MKKGKIISHHPNGYGFIKAEGFAENIFVPPDLMMSLAQLIGVDNFVGKPVSVHFETAEVEHRGKIQIQVTSMTLRISDEELVNEILNALRPAIVKIVDMCRN